MNRDHLVFTLILASLIGIGACIAPIPADPEPPQGPDLQGTGLFGSYFDADGVRVLTRVDPTIDFDWAYGSPDPAVPEDRFSIVWTGWIAFPAAGAYTFFVNADDGVRVFIDDSDDLFGGSAWVDQGLDVEHALEYVASEGMVPLRIEYYENEWNAGIRLAWEGPGRNRETIPMRFLYPGDRVSSPPPGLPFAPVDDESEPIGTAPPDGSERIVTYAVDHTTDFLNPERGWMVRGSAHVIENARTPRTQRDHHPSGYSVIWYDVFGWQLGAPFDGTSGNPFRLDNYKTRDLPPALFDALEDEFALARDSGVKMKIRFSYNYDNTGQDTTLSWMLRHIEQLAPTINANKDTIIGLDAGFVGRWGEWNYERGAVGNLVLELDGGPGNTRWWTEPYRSAYAQVYAKLLEELDEDVMIMMRDPRDDRGYRMYFDGSSDSRPYWQDFDPDDRFTGTDQSRVGWYNDCLFTNQEHAGTFNFDGGKGEIDMQAAAMMGRYAVTNGETCRIGGLNSYNDGPAVIEGMSYLGGPDILFRQYFTDVYDKWIASGDYDEISRRLGYRLALREATLPTSAVPGSLVSVSFIMENSGFGKVYNPRPLELVLTRRSDDSEYRIVLEEDVRRSLPLAGEVTTLSYTVRLPPDLGAGTYELSLALPDTSERLRTDHRYAIRLANQDMWIADDSWNGLNDLGAVVTIT